MPDIPLLRYARINSPAKDALVEVQNVDGKRITVYKDLEVTEKAYASMRHRFKEWILSENLIVLTGAGSSIVSNEAGPIPDEGDTKYAGKTVWDIWQSCKAALNTEDVTTLQTLLAEPEDTVNLERFISKLETFGTANAHSLDATMRENVSKAQIIKNQIIATLKQECQLSLHKSAPHADFLRTILAARKRSQPRLKLFTLNYDTLFEQAAEELNASVIDGFSLTRTPTFNGSNFDLDIVRRHHHRVHHQENYEEKVFQLLKLHGSLDWEKAGENVVRCMGFATDPLIVPPSTHKYEQSYEMPFFEMMSRFQQALRQENTTLIVVGYSFNDAHINRVISEALATNLNFEIIVVSPTVNKDPAEGILADFQTYIGKGRSNITLVSDTFSRFVAAMPKIMLEEDERDVEGVMPMNEENHDIPL